MSKPIEIKCTNCGAPASFNIVNQNYHCSFCGTNISPNITNKSIEDKNKDIQKKIHENIHNFPQEIYNCRSCGADVVINSGEAMGSCPFCTQKLAREEFVNPKLFPEYIIPFKITRKEAKERLELWIEKNKKIKEAEILKKNIDKIDGFYLPYKLVQGPIKCEVTRDMSLRRYRCGGLLNGIAVNTSRQLDNNVLQAAEPFDFSEMKEFDFGFISGHKTKLLDIDDRQISERVHSEVVQQYLPTVRKAMHDTGIDIYIILSDTLKVNALMPMYILNVKGIKTVVNGQTGKVAVLSPDKKKDLRWILEPTLISIAVGVTAAAGFRDLKLAGMLMITAALPAFVAFGQDRKSRVQSKIFKTRNSVALRAGGKVNFLEGNSIIKDETYEKPVFFESIKGKEYPVNISFFSASRIVSWISAAVFVAGLPFFIANLISRGNFTYEGGTAWLCLTIPLIFIFYLAYVRRDVYDSPIIRHLLPDGKTKPLSKSEKDYLYSRKRRNFLLNIKKLMKMKLFWGIFAGILLFLIISILAML